MCAISCYTLDDLSIRECVPNETDNLNLNIFNMIIGINESRTLTKYTSCQCERNFDSSNQKWSNNKR